MYYYMAPMEGLTGYIFRNAYHKYFQPMDKYFTPFIASKGLNHKELNDVLPEHNEGLQVVPQILTNRAETFLAIADKMQKFGYQSVNLNLGCPSGTVVTKGRGAGFLAFPKELDAFLDEIYTKCSLPISIKTRIGMESVEEWQQLQEIFNKYPVEELIIHPRLRREMYKGAPHTEIYACSLQESKNPVCYNGDICSVEDYQRLLQSVPQTKSVMLGRGILKKPWFVENLTGKRTSGEGIPFDRLKAFHDELLEGYRLEMSGDTNTLFKMKELWVYLGQSFCNAEKYLKKIRKSSSVSEYKIVVDQLFREQIKEKE